MKKYFISNSLNDSTNVNFTCDLLNIIIGLFFVILLVMLYYYGNTIKLTYNLYTCITLLVILFILYKIIC